MNLKQFANVDSLYRDLETKQKVPWHEYMSRVIEKLGLHNIKPYIPFSINIIREKLKEDEHLNNLSIKIWDKAAGFTPYVNTTTKVMQYMHCSYGVADLLIRNGITILSVSECVCVLKEAARMLAREAENESHAKA